MPYIKLSIFVLFMNLFTTSLVLAETQICIDLKTISNWDLNLNFTQLEKGNAGLLALAQTPDYQKTYQSYYRLIRSMKLAQVTNFDRNVLRQMTACIEDIPEHRRRQVPSVMGYDLSTPYSPEIFSRELLVQIESNPQIQKSLYESLGKDQYENFIGYLKTSHLDEATFLKILNAISTSSIVLAVFLFIGFFIAVATGGLAAMFIIPFVFAGSLVVTMVDSAYVSIDSFRANQAIKKLDEKSKNEISIESAKLAELIIQSTITQRFTNEGKSIQNRLN